jgi:hypothetical protein
MKTTQKIKLNKTLIIWVTSILSSMYVAPAQAQINQQVYTANFSTQTTYKPLNHYWSNTRTDNFSTASQKGKNAALTAKYRFVRTDGYVLNTSSNAEGQAVPLYLYYNSARKDYFTTASPRGIKSAIAAGYNKVSVEGYVLKTVNSKFKNLYKPLWLYYNNTRKDNFTIATPKGIKDAEAAGYRKVRIEGYIRKFLDIPFKNFPTTTAYKVYQIKKTTKCSEKKIKEILEQATTAKSSVLVNCNLKFIRRDQYITKRLIFEGNKSSNITCDFNGATLDGGKGRVNYKGDMIEVRSKKINANTWERPINILIKRCKVIGSIRIWGMGKNGEAPDVKASSKREASNSKHVQRVRNNAPKNIVFDGITITGVGRNPLYFSPGVTYSKLINSEMKGKSDKTGIYLDAESAYNTIENNYLHVDTKKDKWAKLGYNRGWPQMTIDGSSHNKIIGNRFSNINNGGIYLFRNCGEGGTIRHTPPERNTINNNVFYYKKYKGLNPAIYLGSRDYGWKERTFGHCDKDDGRPYGSSKSDKDYAKFNTIKNNKFYKRKINDQSSGPFPYLRDATPDDLIKTKNKSANSPNYISNNKMIKH